MDFCHADAIKERERRLGKRKRKKQLETVKDTEEKCVIEAEDDFFEDAPPCDESSSFQQMNLSRPLMKVRFRRYFTGCILVAFPLASELDPKI